MTLLTQYFNQLIHTGWVHDVGWVLVHSLWQITLIAGVYAVAAFAFRLRSASLRYLTGCIAMTGMLVGPVVTFCRLPESAGVIAVGEAELLASQPSDYSSLPIVVDKQSAEAPVSTDPFFVALPSKQIETATPSGEIDRLSIAQRLSLLIDPWLPVATVIWFLGVMLLSLRPLVGFLHVRSLRRRGLSLLSESHAQLSECLVKRLGIRHAVKFAQSAFVEVPAVIGYLRPLVLLPASTVTGLTTAELELILAHELAHVRRHDYFFNLCQTMIEALFFYHPGMWWVSSQIRQERENCCDDVAVAMSGDRATYIRALAQLEKHRVAPPVLAATNGSLVARVRRLLGEPQVEFGHRKSGIFMTIVMTAGIAVTTASLAGFPSGESEAADNSRESIEAEANDNIPSQEDTLINFDKLVGQKVAGVVREAKLPFVDETRLADIEADFAKFISGIPYGSFTVGGSIPAKQRETILLAIEEHGAKHLRIDQFQPGDLRSINLAYLGLPDRLLTLKWKLHQAIIHARTLDAYKQAKLGAQQAWMKQHIQSLPNYMSFTKEMALSGLEERLADPLCVTLAYPMTDQQFVLFQDQLQKFNSQERELAHVVSHTVQQSLNAQYRDFGDFELPFSDRVVSYGAGRIVHLGFESNRPFTSSSRSIHEIESSGTVIDATTGHLVTVPKESREPGDFQRWLIEEGKGDFGFDDARGGGLFAVRGAKLVKLDVETWVEADAISNDELRAWLEGPTAGRTVSLKKHYQDYQRDNSPSPCYVGVMTQEGRLAVVAVEDFSGRNSIVLRTRARSTLPKMVRAELSDNEVTLSFDRPAHWVEREIAISGNALFRICGYRQPTSEADGTIPTIKVEFQDYGHPYSVDVTAKQNPAATINKVLTVAGEPARLISFKIPGVAGQNQPQRELMRLLFGKDTRGYDLTFVYPANQREQYVELALVVCQSIRVRAVERETEKDSPAGDTKVRPANSQTSTQVHPQVNQSTNVPIKRLPVKGNVYRWRIESQQPIRLAGGVAFVETVGESGKIAVTGSSSSSNQTPYTEPIELQLEVRLEDNFLYIKRSTVHLGKQRTGKTSSEKKIPVPAGSQMQVVPWEARNWPAPWNESNQWSSDPRLTQNEYANLWEARFMTGKQVAKSIIFTARLFDAQEIDSSNYFNPHVINDLQMPEANDSALRLKQADDTKATLEVESNEEPTPIKGLEFLAGIPEFAKVRIGMSEEQFKEVIARQDLVVQSTCNKNNNTSSHTLRTLSGKTVIVMFGDGKCSGIQRMRDQLAWGSTIGGVKIALTQKPSLAWTPEQPPKLVANVMHQGPDVLLLSSVQTPSSRLKVDGILYRHPGQNLTGVDYHTSSLRTDHADGIGPPIVLDTQWRSVNDDRPLRLKPGQHLVSYGWPGFHPATDAPSEPDQDRPVLLWSGEIEVAVVGGGKMKDGDDWGDATDGVKLRIHSPEARQDQGQWKVICKTDIRADAERILPHYGAPIDDYAIQWNGQWYRSTNHAANLAASVGPSMATRRNSMHTWFVARDWVSEATGKSMPALSAGKHTLRIALLPVYSNEIDSKRPLRAVSNEIDVEIPAFQPDHTLRINGEHAQSGSITGRVEGDFGPYVVLLEHENWKDKLGELPNLLVKSGETFQFTNVPVGQCTVTAKPTLAINKGKHLEKTLSTTVEVKDGRTITADLLSDIELGEQPDLRTTTLPDVDRRDIHTVLDLGSGEFIENFMRSGDFGKFTEIGKGDLWQDGPNAIGTVRGGKIVFPDGRKLVRAERQTRAYELPDLPCQLVVVSAEGRSFDVEVTAKNADGLTIEYIEKAIPRVRIDPWEDMEEWLATRAVKLLALQGIERSARGSGDPDLRIAKLYDAEWNGGIHLPDGQPVAEAFYLRYLPRAKTSMERCEIYTQLSVLFSTTLSRELGEEKDLPKAREYARKAIAEEPERISRAIILARLRTFGSDMPRDEIFQKRLNVYQWLTSWDETSIRNNWTPTRFHPYKKDYYFNVFVNHWKNVTETEAANLVSSAHDDPVKLKQIIDTVPGTEAAERAAEKSVALNAVERAVTETAGNESGRVGERFAGLYQGRLGEKVLTWRILQYNGSYYFKENPDSTTTPDHQKFTLIDGSLVGEDPAERFRFTPDEASGGLIFEMWNKKSGESQGRIALKRMEESTAETNVEESNENTQPHPVPSIRPESNNIVRGLSSRLERIAPEGRARIGDVLHYDLIVKNETDERIEFDWSTGSMWQPVVDEQTRTIMLMGSFTGSGRVEQQHVVVPPQREKVIHHARYRIIQGASDDTSLPCPLNVTPGDYQILAAGVWGSTPRMDILIRPAARFEVRLTLPENVKQQPNADSVVWRGEDRQERTLYLDRQIYLDEDDVIAAKLLAGDSNQLAKVELLFSKEAESRLRAITQTAALEFQRTGVERRLAILLNGKVISASLIDTTASNRMVVSGISKAQARDLLAFPIARSTETDPVIAIPGGTAPEPSVVELVISKERGGQISPGGVGYSLDSELIMIDQLQERLKEKLKETPELKLLIRVDPELPIQSVVVAMQLANAAGVKAVNLASTTDQNSKPGSEGHAAATTENTDLSATETPAVPLDIQVSPDGGTVGCTIGDLQGNPLSVCFDGRIMSPKKGVTWETIGNQTLGRIYQGAIDPTHEGATLVAMGSFQEGLILRRLNSLLKSKLAPGVEEQMLAPDRKADMFTRLSNQAGMTHLSKDQILGLANLLQQVRRYERLFLTSKGVEIRIEQQFERQANPNPIPPLLISAVNRGELEGLTLGRTDQAFELEVDGEWYRQTRIQFRSSPLSPGRIYEPFPLILDQRWIHMNSNKPLGLNPGLHGIRVRQVMHPFPSNAKSMTAISDKLQIQVLKARRESSKKEDS
ncbi:M56 family metallopeptidase [Neorhodopirellula lusitana]|uniref:M56 family metallopeptidase n=1 Tax=Neorhodopirellula lusitana TaxID=445327 RepID=UPI00384BD01B